MADYDPKYEKILLKQTSFDSKTIETTPIQDFLNPMIKLLKMEIESVMDHLGCPKDMDEEVMQIVRALNAAEIMHMHYEFTIEVLETNSEEEVERLKDKYHLIKRRYDKVKTKEDFTLIPAKHCATLFYEPIILQFLKLMKKMFKRHHNGEIELVRNRETYVKIRILAHKFEMCDIHYPLSITYNKDDIFTLEKSSPIWQELYQAATFKQVLTPEQIKFSFGLFYKTLHLSHLLLTKERNQSSSIVKTICSDIKDLAYYGIFQSKAHRDVLHHLLSANIEEAFSAWNLTDHPVVSKLLLLRTPGVTTDELIYVPRLFPAITEEVILKEYEENTFNKLCPMDPALLTAPEIQNRRKIIEELFIQAENKIPIRILGPEKLNLRGLANNETPSPEKQNKEKAVIIHIHGGGFVAMSSGSHRVYLNRWVRDLQLIHFSIDYRLAPKNQYPDALDDVWQAYLWIMNYASTVLGINCQKVIITGDSAGGNLAAALTLRLIRAGVKPPSGTLLIYPCLSVDGYSSSPSYFTDLDDPLLPYTILKLVAKAYVKEGFRNLEDPFISPMFASDELLEHFPPTRIVHGSYDPLYDDSWRLLAKLKKLKKDAKLIVHENMSHGYMCYQELTNYEHFIEESGDLMKELIALAP